MIDCTEPMWSTHLIAHGVVDVTPHNGPNGDSSIDLRRAREKTPHMDVRDRHVVVTGASRGIGNALARQFASKGARVTVVARNAQQLEQLAGEIGGHALPADLFDTAEVASLIERCEALGGPVEVLANNAGMEKINSIFETGAADVEQVMRLNLLVPIELTRQVLPGMRERRSGHILNISSIAAYGSVLGMGIYSSSKAGLSQFTRAIRHEVKDLGIGFTAIAPGPVPTDFMANMHHLPALTCIERFGKFGLLKEVTPEQVAKKAVRAVEKGKSTVVMPRRAAMFGLVGGINQSIVNTVIAGVK